MIIIITRQFRDGPFNFFGRGGRRGGGGSGLGCVIIFCNVTLERIFSNTDYLSSRWYDILLTVRNLSTITLRAPERWSERTSEFSIGFNIKLVHYSQSLFLPCIKHFTTEGRTNLVTSSIKALKN